MRTATWLIALSWGGLTGFVTASMTGVWWQLPYWAIGTVVCAVGGFVALGKAR